jgi:AcrR family transcriptional regulator
MGLGNQRTRAKRETRQALLQAGLAEVVEKGLDGPSLDVICARAGFTRGAFYVHFANRDDFVVQLMDWVFSGFLDSIVTASSGDGSLRDVIDRFLAALDSDQLPLSRLGARLPQLLEASYRLPQVRERMRGLILEAIERVSKRALEDQQRGQGRLDIDPKCQATVLVAAALGGMMMRDAGVPIEFPPVRDAVLRGLKP